VAQPGSGKRTFQAAFCGGILLHRAVLLLAAVLVLTLAVAARADAFVYWANTNAGTIGRANLDGTGVNQNFIINLSVPGG
jgi:hypothetical protein